MAIQGKKLSPALEFIDDPTVGELYADAVSGYGIINGTVAITLEAARWDYDQADSSPKRVVVARLRMSVPAAQNLALGLFDFLARRGLDPARKPPDEPVQ